MTPEEPSLLALRSFVVLAEELHFTRAALRLHLAQPALTKRIKQLEDDLGCPLFQRTRRQVRLTPEGEQLLPEAQRLLQHAAEFRQAAERVAGGATPRLRIGFTPSAPHHVLPRVMLHFRQRQPQVQCLLIEASSEQQIARLLEGTLDVGLLRPPAGTVRGLTWTTCLEEPFVALLPRDHRLAARKQIALDALAGEPLVLVSRAAGAAVHAQIMAACAAAHFTPRIAQEATTASAVVAMVAAGSGIAILPTSAAIAPSGVVARPLVGTTLRTVMVVALAAGRRSAAVNAFVQSARA